MKYKIKVEVMQDGSSRYYPMVKKHWWSLWKYIDCCLRIGFYSNGLHASIKETAEFRIEAYKQLVVDHTYEIPYKKEEE